MAAKKKRKLTPYNIHIQKETKKGLTFKQATQTWGTKKSKSPSRTRKNRGAGNRRPYKMAKKKSYRRRAAAALKPQSILIGGAAYSIIEPKFNEMTRGIGGGVPDDLIKLVAGYYATKQRHEIIKGIGYAAMFHGIRNLTAGTLGVASATTEAKPSGLLF